MDEDSLPAIRARDLRWRAREVCVYRDGTTTRWKRNEQMTPFNASRAAKDRMLLVKELDRLGRVPSTGGVMSDIKEGDFVLELANGGKIVSEGEEHETGAVVRVMDPEGKELGCWDKQEWADAPEEVMGAILKMANSAHWWPVPPPAGVVPARPVSDLKHDLANAQQALGLIKELLAAKDETLATACREHVMRSAYFEVYGWFKGMLEAAAKDFDLVKPDEAAACRECIAKADKFIAEHEHLMEGL